MPWAQVEQTRVSFGPQLADDDPTVGVAERDGGHGLIRATHACAMSHARRLFVGWPDASTRVQARAVARQDTEGHATVSDPSGVSGKSHSAAHDGRDPMMMTFVPTGTSSYNSSTCSLCMRMHPCEA